jgi:hypothetical protein
MAEIVLGIGCSHTPQLHTPAGQWEIRAERDKRDGLPLWYQGQRVTYAELEAKRQCESLDRQLDMAVREARLQAAHRAIENLSYRYAAANPDVTLIFGNDQGEIFLDDPKPAITIMGADEFENLPRTEAQASRLPPGIALSDVGHLPDSGMLRIPGHPELARRLATWLSEHDFEISFAPRQVRPDPARAQTSGMPHAYGFIYKQIMRDRLTPHVPIDINTFYPPNQPDTRRCYDLGRAVARCVLDWDSDARVCVVASGGLSHFVVDEIFDRDVMTALEADTTERLFGYDENWFQAGSSEIKSWIALGGVMSRTELEGQIVDYHALYRTPGGTGSSAAFMAWE